MNRDQKKEKRRELRRRAKERSCKKELLLEEELDKEIDVPITAIPLSDSEGDDQEPLEKDYGIEPCVYAPVPGPTSFEELDEMQVAEEKAYAVLEVTWDTRDLVRNILNHPDLDPVEKAEAMKVVADEFAARVATTMEEDVSKDMDIDLLELEAIIAHDHRTTTVAEQITDFSKSVLTAAVENKLSDEKFALVIDRDGKKVRKYPIHDKAHVRNTMARAAQMIKRGGPDASDAKSALPKIHSAAKKMGIGSNMDKEHNAILIEKDANDKWRWVGWASNNFIDWDGDIISASAHEEYVEWWEKNKESSPVFDTWHLPGTARKNPVDFIMFEKGFLIMSGPLEDEEAAGLFRAQKEYDLGMSIGAIGLGRDPKDTRVITKYRAYAITDLPVENAANPFTDFETVIKEVGMDNKLGYLTKILGSEERAKAFLEKTETKQKELLDAGVESKEKKDDIEELDVKTEVPLVVDEPAKVAGPGTGGVKPEQLVEQVMKEMDIEGLNAFVAQAKIDHEKVGVLEELIKELQGSQEDKLAEVLTPPAARFAWSKENRASQAEDTVIEKDDKLNKEKPGVPDGYWMSEITQTTPIKE